MKNTEMRMVTENLLVDEPNSDGFAAVLPKILPPVLVAVEPPNKPPVVVGAFLFAI